MADVGDAGAAWEEGEDLTLNALVPDMMDQLDEGQELDWEELSTFFPEGRSAGDLKRRWEILQARMKDDEVQDENNPKDDWTALEDSIIECTTEGYALGEEEKMEYVWPQLSGGLSENKRTIRQIKGRWRWLLNEKDRIASLGDFHEDTDEDVKPVIRDEPADDPEPQAGAAPKSPPAQGDQSAWSPALAAPKLQHPKEANAAAGPSGSSKSPSAASPLQMESEANAVDTPETSTSSMAIGNDFEGSENVSASDINPNKRLVEDIYEAVCRVGGHQNFAKNLEALRGNRTIEEVTGVFRDEYSKDMARWKTTPFSPPLLDRILNLTSGKSLDEIDWHQITAQLPPTPHISPIIVRFWCLSERERLASLKKTLEEQEQLLLGAPTGAPRPPRRAWTKLSQPVIERLLRDAPPREVSSRDPRWLKLSEEIGGGRSASALRKIWINSAHNPMRISRPRRKPNASSDAGSVLDNASNVGSPLGPEEEADDVQKDQLDESLKANGCHSHRESSVDDNQPVPAKRPLPTESPPVSAVSLGKRPRSSIDEDNSNVQDLSVLSETSCDPERPMFFGPRGRFDKAMASIGRLMKAWEDF